MFDPLSQYQGAEELGLAEEGQHVNVEQLDAGEATVVAEVNELTAVIEEQTAEIEKLADVVNDLEETVEDLEESVDGLESMLNSGNFNSVSFTHTYNRAMRLAEKLGCDHQGDRVGAEAMSDVATANLHARTGIEAIGETLKNWGAKAVAFVKHIFNQIINFFVSIVSKADGLQRREKQLRDRLNAGGKIKDKVKLGGWNVYCDYATAGLVGNSAKNKGSLDGANAGVAGLVDEASKVDGITVAGVKSAYSALVSGLKADAKSFGKYNEKKQGSKDIVLAQNAGIRFTSSFADPTITTLAEGAAAIRSVSISIGKAPEAKKMSSGEVKAKLDKGGLTAALDHVKAEIANIRESKLAKKMTAGTRDQVIGKLNNAKAGTEGDAAKDGSAKVGVVKAAFSLAAKLTAIGDRQDLNNAGAILDGVAAHLGFGAAAAA